MQLPQQVLLALEILEKNGYEAFIVGGCVRDFLLDRKLTDYDITTNATPEQMLLVFADYRVIQTGIKHGTITVIIDGLHLEITTYRTDGEYIDNRHPENVIFTTLLKEDLARRDFTMNTVCFNPKTGFVDVFGGMEDIKNGVIRAVGNPNKRFCEDALRILRGVRFAANYGFFIEEETRQAIFAQKELLENISCERIATELVKTLCGSYQRQVMGEYHAIFGQVIPEIIPMANFAQQNPYHVHDILMHTLVVVENVPPKKQLKLAALLHDIGKPETFTIDEKGIGHFYGHGKKSEEIARKICNSLNLDNKTKDNVVTLVKYHDYLVENNSKAIKRWLLKIGEELFFDLMELKKGDIIGQNPEYIKRLDYITQLEISAREIIATKQCFNKKGLMVNGKDLIKIGVLEGKEIGNILDELLEMVISGEIENKRDALLNFVKAKLI